MRRFLFWMTLIPATALIWLGVIGGILYLFDKYLSHIFDYLPRMLS